MRTIELLGGDDNSLRPDSSVREEHVPHGPSPRGAQLDFSAVAEFLSRERAMSTDAARSRHVS